MAGQIEQESVDAESAFKAAQARYDKQLAVIERYKKILLSGEAQPLDVTNYNAMLKWAKEYREYAARAKDRYISGEAAIARAKGRTYWADFLEGTTRGYKRN